MKNTEAGFEQTKSTCRFCGAPLKLSMVDLGMSPISNANVRPGKEREMEPFYPLSVHVCESCWLVQLDEYIAADEIFTDEYPYFSSYSTSWLEHARHYCETITERLGLDERSQVVELASNDGYLLKNFKQQGIKVLGVEPCANVAAAAEEIGIPSLVKFFGVETAQEMVADGIRADLLIGNNVLAHVPDLNDFVQGMKLLLADDGVITMEFPHLKKLIELNQFDTIYHEHFSYFSLVAVERIFKAFGLTIYDVEQLPTHGGSLRIHARHDHDDSKPVRASVETLRAEEIAAGYETPEIYRNYAEKVRKTKREFLSFLIEAKNQGKSVVGYGAPAKGNTLLNYCGVRKDFLDYTVDINPHKQGTLLPGTHIPVYPPQKIDETRPDYVVILPWNLKEEIRSQMAHIMTWGAQFVVAIPFLEIL